MRKGQLLLVLLGLSLLISGCAAPMLATAAAPVGLAAARAGTTAYSNGKLRVARYGTLDETWQAVHDALDRLQLTVHNTRQGERRYYIVARDENRYPEMKIQLDRRSPVMTKISIRVGLFGDPAVSNLLLRHIDESLLQLREEHPTPLSNRLSEGRQ